MESEQALEDHSLINVDIDRRRPVGPQIYDAVRLEIILENLKPGMQLNEMDLCRSLNVSRTPVREAYQHLASDGLIKIRSKVGTVVAPIDQERVKEGIIIRRALEREVVRMICQNNVNLSKLDDIIALQSVCVSHMDAVGFFKRDEAFHAQLAEIAGLPSVSRLAHSVKAHTDRARFALTRDIPNRINIAFQEHLEIVSALKTQNEELATALISKHINSAFDVVNDHAE